MRGQDILPKARKNEVEIKGARAAHLRDGAAVVRFLAWLDREAPGGRLDEITAARKLEEFRAETKALLDISFDTISASGPNGAIVHYRVTEATNRRLKSGELYLVDSGGPYLDSDRHHTSTISRPLQNAGAVHARPERPYRHHNHALPRDTGSASTPSLAVRSGKTVTTTERGTASEAIFLCTRPRSISTRNGGMEPGMIISSEPGYYKEGAYGIRLKTSCCHQAGARRRSE